MKRSLKFIILMLMILIMVGCQDTPEEKQLKQVTMTIKEDTLTNKGASIIITDLNDDELHSYDTSFRIDKKEDGKWITLEDIQGEIYSYGAFLEVNEDHILEQDINWKRKYGELSKGDYRLVKEAHIFESKDPRPNVVYAEFSIE